MRSVSTVTHLDDVTEPTGALSESLISQLRTNDFIKIIRKNERFWVRIIEMRGSIVVGQVDNHLQLNNDIKCGDVVTFESSKIYSVIFGNGRKRCVK